MTFSVPTTERVSGLGEYDRIDDLVPFDLRGDERSVFHEFLVEEFYFSSVSKCFDPLLIRRFRVS